MAEYSSHVSSLSLWLFMVGAVPMNVLFGFFTSWWSSFYDSSMRRFIWWQSSSHISSMWLLISWWRRAHIMVEQFLWLVYAAFHMIAEQFPYQFFVVFYIMVEADPMTVLLRLLISWCSGSHDCSGSHVCSLWLFISWRRQFPWLFYLASHIMVRACSLWHLIS